MGNCCRSPAAVAREDVKSSNHSGHDHNNRKEKTNAGNGKKGPVAVLADVSKENIEEKYALDRELGRGEFGVTYLCIDRSSRELLACKSISKRKLRTAVDVDDVRREVEIMKHLPENSSIVTLREACEDENAVHLVMELCEGGELFDRIVARGHYTERAAAAVTRTIVEVVQLCHKHGVIHRDLKPENFLFANKKENSPLKAIDFGLSIFFKPGERFSEIVGSPYYMAPEVLKRNYGPEIDIWSAGVILYILLCGVPPFWAESEQGVAQAILRGLIDFKREPWPSVSEGAKSLVRQMLEPDPKLRLMAKQVLEHSWIQNAKKAPNVPLGDVVKSRLKQFSMMNRFKRKALRVIADFLSNEEVEDIKDMFKKIDTDDDGTVTIEELKTGLHKLNTQLAESEVQLLIEAVDTNGKGTLDYGAFVAISLHMWKMANKEHLHKAFSYFDKDGNGYIEPDELRDTLMEDGDDNSAYIANDIFQKVDTDKDGKISYDEFAAMIKTGTDWRKASRHYSRRFNNLSVKLMKDGSLNLGSTGSVASMWSCASAKPKPVSTLVKTFNAIPVSNDAQVRAKGSIEGGSCDNDDRQMNFTKPSNGVGRISRVILDFIDRGDNNLFPMWLEFEENRAWFKNPDRTLWRRARTPWGGIPRIKTWGPGRCCEFGRDRCHTHNHQFFWDIRCKMGGGSCSVDWEAK